MINDCNTTFPKELMDSEWEKPLQGISTNYFKLMATDYEKQGEDCLLYPGKISKFTLTTIKCKIIPMVVEFDVHRRDALELIGKLKESEMYVDHSMYAEVHKNFFMDEKCGDRAEQFYRDMNKAFKCLLTTAQEISNDKYETLPDDLEGKPKDINELKDEIEVK